jgi:hypothetical protein
MMLRIALLAISLSLLLVQHKNEISVGCAKTLQGLKQGH